MSLCTSFATYGFTTTALNFTVCSDDACPIGSGGSDAWNLWWSDHTDPGNGDPTTPDSSAFISKDRVQVIAGQDVIVLPENRRKSSDIEESLCNWEPLRADHLL